MKIEIKIKRWRVLPDYKNGDALEKLWVLESLTEILNMWYSPAKKIG